MLGVAAIVGKIPVDSITLKRAWPTTFAASLLLYFFASDGHLQHYEGYILLALLTAYLSVLLVYTKKEHIKLDIEIPKDDESKIESVKDSLLLVFGVTCLYFGSEWFIIGGESLATDLGVSRKNHWPYSAFDRHEPSRTHHFSDCRKKR